jgi:hypothetical protein
MLVPLSKLRQKFVRDVVLAIEQGRAELAGKHYISTGEPEIQFSMEVFLDDETTFVEGDLSESVTPDTTTETTKGAETSTQTQEAVTTTEKQTTTPGEKVASQAFGRSTTTEVSETT